MTAVVKALALSIWILGVFCPPTLFAQQSPIAPVTLRVSVDGKELASDEIVTLGRGQSVQLGVKVVRTDGTVSDVTIDPFTTFASLTSWNLTVSHTGLVTAVGSGGFSEEVRSLKRGAIDVWYGIKPATGETLNGVGNITVEFNIKD